MTQSSIQLSTTPPYPGLQMVNDINSALQALGSDFAGPNDPAAYAKPYMTWADTTSGQLKRRNAAGTAWVVEGSLFRPHMAVFSRTEIPSVDVGPIYVRGVGAMAWNGVRYALDGVVGTVSQSAGAPTGAILERGSNANGTFIKWADGTMVCITEFAFPSTGSFSGQTSVAIAASPRNWSAPFIATPSISVAYVGDWCIQLMASLEGNVSATSTGKVYVSNVFSVTLPPFNGRVCLQATGRWF